MIINNFVYSERPSPKASPKELKTQPKHEEERLSPVPVETLKPTVTPPRQLAPPPPQADPKDVLSDIVPTTRVESKKTGKGLLINYVTQLGMGGR